MSILTGNYLTPLMPFYDRDEQVLKEIFDSLDAEELDRLDRSENVPLFPPTFVVELWEEINCYA